MLAYLFVIIAAGLRFLPHPFHFTPVGASLLFFGAYRPKREMWIPVAVLAGSDLLLNRFVYNIPLHADQLVVWAWYAGAIAIGMLLRKQLSAPRVAGASLSASISFYLVSNFAVWATYEMYPKTWQGLVACYAAAVPFFRNTVVADLIFSAVLFSIPLAIAALRHQKATA
jgi:uncharacterized protein DUF6580